MPGVYLLVLRLIICLFFLPSCISAQNPVRWTGAVTQSSAIVQVTAFELAEAHIVCTSPGADTLIPLKVEVFLNGLSHKFHFNNLEPETRYTYQVSINGTEYPELAGSFTTFPATPSGFTFLASACSRIADHPVYDYMHRDSALFFICTGDLHYRNYSTEGVTERINAIREDVLLPEPGRTFYTSTPVVYMWDDHDYCGNNSNSQCPAREEALEAYRTAVPHYPTFRDEVHTPVAQAFSAGRVRFIITDLRTERNELFMMSREQESWLFDEILHAHRAGMMVCWVNTVPWIGNTIDTWGDYPAQRLRISDFIRRNSIVNFFILSGDAHMIAADDGTHSDYSTFTSNHTPFPVLQSAALNQQGAIKGGPWSEGAWPNEEGTGQYAEIRVTDNEAEICVEFKGYRVNASGTARENLLNYSFCRNIQAELNFTVVPNPSPGAIELRIYNFPAIASSPLELIDQAGKLLYSERVNLIRGDNRFTIDPGPSLAAGLYMVRFRYDGEWHTARVSVVP